LTYKISINKNISDLFPEVTQMKLWIRFSPFVRPLKHEDVPTIEIISQNCIRKLIIVSKWHLTNLVWCRRSL